MASSPDVVAAHVKDEQEDEVIEITESFHPRRRYSDSDSDHDSVRDIPSARAHRPPKLGHGAFSSCICKRCMESAKIEVEKRFSDETLTTNYIKKLEDLVSSLEVNQNRYCSDTESEDSRDRGFDSFLTPPPQPPPADFFTSAGPPFKPVKEKSRPRWRFQDVGATSKKDADVGARLEIKHKRKIYQTYGEPRVEPDLGNFVAGDDIKVIAKHESVLTVVREYDVKKNFWRKTIEILSPEFVQTLGEVTPYDVELPPRVDGFLILSEPLMPLFWNRRYLTDFVEKDSIANPEKDKLAKAHTRLILDWMRNENVETSKKLDDVESATSPGLIDFQDLWMLYAPGTIVFSKEEGEWEALVVDSVRGCQKSVRRRSGQHDYTRLDLTCWSIDYDGEVFGRVWTTHCITPFQNKKEITSLSLVPERFMPECGFIKETLRARGKQFWELQGQNYKEYTGEIYSQRLAEGATRVIVDHLTYQRRENWPIVINQKKGPSAAVSKNWRDDRFNSSHRFSRRNHHYDEFVHPPRNRAPPPLNVDVRNSYTPEGDYYDPPTPQNEMGSYTVYPADRPPQKEKDIFTSYDVIEPEDTPDDFVCMLCPQRVHGFCLRDKVWKDLNVSQMRPVSFRKNAWTRLVLDEEYKDIVTAMVSSYSAKTPHLDDLVAGKGAGLVALLHGPPGTGKTLTAECVAESFEKPLYQVTCGDIGTSATHLEDRLEEIFDYATTWGAILLLDEADVFLQDRDHSHLERNALVSIFLRTLEYFNGILFLTTNRVGMFDQAFQSRVHVTLGLPALDQGGREAVWSIFLNDLAAKSAITTAQCEQLTSLVKTAWAKRSLNGRQIRNTVRTAMVVAEKKGEPLAKGHFETVLRLGGAFEGYMRALKGTEGEVAERRGERLADEEGVVVV